MKNPIKRLMIDRHLLGNWNGNTQ